MSRGRQFERLAGDAVLAGALAVDHAVDAVIAEDALEERDVGEARHVVEGQRLVGQEARDHQRQGGVLGAGNRDGAVQPGAADDANAIHDVPLSPASTAAKCLPEPQRARPV